jgi:hypothetical protein
MDAALVPQDPSNPPAPAATPGGLAAMEVRRFFMCMHHRGWGARTLMLQRSCRATTRVQQSSELQWAVQLQVTTCHTLQTPACSSLAFHQLRLWRWYAAAPWCMHAPPQHRCHTRTWRHVLSMHPLPLCYSNAGSICEHTPAGGEGAGGSYQPGGEAHTSEGALTVSFSDSLWAPGCGCCAAQQVGRRPCA